MRKLVGLSSSNDRKLISPSSSLDLDMSTDVICQLAYDGRLEELQTKLRTDLKLASKKFQVRTCLIFFNS